MSGRSRFFVITAASVLALQLAAAQTKITPPKNKYTPEQDVQLGREAAAEVRKQYPIIRDARSRAISIGSASGWSRRRRPS